jgi:transcriptional regulator GlxA family with amidase domain
MPAIRNVAVVLFPGVELLDFAGPVEVFSVASRWAEPPAFNVYTVAEKPGPVVAKNGLSVNAHHLLADCPALAVLLGLLAESGPVHVEPLLAHKKLLCSRK